MLLLRCTQTLLRELKAVGFVVEEADDDAFDPFQIWFANPIRVGRRKYVILTNPRTLYTICIPGPGKRELPHLGRIVRRHIEDSLARDDLSEIGELRLGPDDGVRIAKTNDRSTLGSMRELAFQTEAWCESEPDPTTLDFDALGAHLNDVLMGALDYATPFERTTLELEGYAEPGRWERVQRTDPGPGTRSSTHSVRSPDVVESLRVAVVSSQSGRVRCRVPGANERFVFRGPGARDLLPGHIADLRVEESWQLGERAFLLGEVAAYRIDAAALEVEPLALTPCGPWDPATDFYLDDSLSREPWERSVLELGVRRQYEMEQVIPGADPEDYFTDPIIEAAELSQLGRSERARRALCDLLDLDVRCIDAHVHLGNLAFDWSPKKALAHYEIGCAIGDLTLGLDFSDVLPWGLIDNRPYLRALVSRGLCLWRLERWEEAEAVFHRALHLNPSDNQGVRFLLPEVLARQVWTRESR